MPARIADDSRGSALRPRSLIGCAEGLSSRAAGMMRRRSTPVRVTDIDLFDHMNNGCLLECDRDYLASM